MGRRQWAWRMAVAAGWCLATLGVVQAKCLPVERLGPAPTRLLVITPATGQGRADWQTFVTRLKREPAATDMALLVFEHGIRMMSLGSAEAQSRELGACIAEKLAANPGFTKLTLIGHSIGGMLTRRAYLDAFKASDADARWSTKVDNILLFASVNRGIPASTRVSWWAPAGDWARRNLPRFGLPVRFVLEDMAYGSDFIADVRIEWIRRFGALAEAGALPRIVQFWGSDDSVVTERDNADLQAFNGDVVEKIPGARHGDIQRLDGFADDPDARWALFRKHLFAAAPPAPARRADPERRVLFIVRGIRDSSYADWVTALKQQAEKLYGVGNVFAPEYGFFTAAQFAMKPIRSKNIPSFRDFYAEELAKNPRTQFDVIAHSNGTYIVASSLESTPSMRFRHVAFAAPVLPVEFPWAKLLERRQVESVRYDTAREDWPVGILCPGLRALGYTDVGPAGLVLFGTPVQWASSTGLRNIGWYAGGHGAALMPGNREHLLRFAWDGSHFEAGEPLLDEAGPLATWSRATPFLAWVLFALLGLGLWYLRRRAGNPARWSRILAGLAATFAVLYALLDVF